MDVNTLLDYPGENGTCLEFQSLDEIVASVLNVDDEPEDDDVETVTCKEFEKTTPQVLDAIRKIRDELQKYFVFKKKHAIVDIYI
ncbi:hypothetical protein BRARA_I00618 [Brassica rapa]|uniref:Uncharacterized protein n=1 Tax=Brassica campestris TaxID=3711 RepID=A0A397XRE8_BRACM|nr:hypothetical protein BRARA_I00618 [Brassica rapa]